ncbi:basic salivary proline-rich protein 4-like [Solea solea]|uniref:basic salivary proline-rich protein 4-like n=1 Tax=Solea solea TaxID=90069 RepID=UPI0027299A3A|nr:basic salivary proline-rich protein 4-like [Solea solea]
MSVSPLMISYVYWASIRAIPFHSSTYATPLLVTGHRSSPRAPWQRDPQPPPPPLPHTPYPRPTARSPDKFSGAELIDKERLRYAITGVNGIWVGDRANVRPVPSDGPKIIQAPKAPSSRGQSEECGGRAPPTQGQPEGADGDKTTDRGRTTPHPGRPQRPRVPAPRARQRPRAGPAHHRGEKRPPQTAHQGGTARYPPLPPPPPPRSRPHAPQPREGQAEARVGPPAKGAPRDGREADSRAGPDPPGRGRASGPRTRRAQPRGAPERGPPTSRSICARRRPPPGRQTAAHHSTFREVRHDEPQPCLPDTPQTERRGSDPPRPVTPHGHHCCPHPDRQSQHGQGVSRNRALRSAPATTPPHPSPPGHMPHSHPPPAKKGATRPGQGHAMASHECRRGGGPDTPTPDQKVGPR